VKNGEDQQCKGKVQYRDELSAKIAMARQGRAGRLGPQDRMSIYRCQYCGYWHMGHGTTGVPWHQLWR
jgi:hypothetical protein